MAGGNKAGVESEREGGDVPFASMIPKPQPHHHVPGYHPVAARLSFLFISCTYLSDIICTIEDYKQADNVYIYITNILIY